MEREFGNTRLTWILRRKYNIWLEVTLLKTKLLYFCLSFFLINHNILNVWTRVGLACLYLGSSPILFDLFMWGPILVSWSIGFSFLKFLNSYLLSWLVKMIQWGGVSSIDRVVCCLRSFVVCICWMVCKLNA